MVLLHKPKRSFLKKNYGKPLTFFKDCKLTIDGFQFESFNEFKVEDSFSNTKSTINSAAKTILLNDLYFVQMTNTKDTVSIYFRKNFKFYDSETSIPEIFSRPFFIGQDCFQDPADLDFYKFLRTLETGVVRLSFKMNCNKILLNGDQILFMFADRIIIYSPLGVSTIKCEPLDMAINGYLNILTRKQILIYNESLFKTIDINIVCDFIVASTHAVFCIRSNIIYKIEGDTAEIYYDIGHAHIKNVTHDDKFIYGITNNGVIKVGLYEKTLKHIWIEVSCPKICVNDDFIIVFSAINSFALIDKNDFSSFSLRTLDFPLTAICMFKKYVVFSSNKESRIFKYKKVDKGVEIAEKNTKNFSELFIGPKIKSLEDFDKVKESHHIAKHYKKLCYMALESKRFTFDEILEKSKEMRNSVDKDFLQSMFAFEDQKGALVPNIEQNIMADMVDCADSIVCENNEQFDTKIQNEPQKADNLESSQLLLGSQSASKGFSLSQLMPTPRQTQNDLYDTDESKMFKLNETIDRNQDLLFHQTHEYSEKLTKLCKLRLKQVQKYTKKLKDEESSTTSETEQLFFGEPDNNLPIIISNPLLHLLSKCSRKNKRKKIRNAIQMHQSDVTNSTLLGTIDNGSLNTNACKSLCQGVQQTLEDSKECNFDAVDLNSISQKLTNEENIVKNTSNKLILSAKSNNTPILAYDLFSRIPQKFRSNNPLTYHNPVKALFRNDHVVIKNPKSCTSYEKSTFFISNHVKYFEETFEPRTSEIKQSKHQVYDFINEEFRKFLGYVKPNPIDVTKKKTDLPKKKKSGF